MNKFENYLFHGFFFCCIFFLVACSKQEKNESVKDKKEEFNSIFFDINGTKIPNKNPDSLQQTKVAMQDLNLLDSTKFWSGHKNYFMHSIGSIDFPNDTTYTFRLTVIGKIILRLNNKDLFNIGKISDTVLVASQFVDAGKNIFEIEYFDGKLSPKIILEWMPSEGNYQVIPTKMFERANLKLDSIPYQKAAANPPLDSSHPNNKLTEQEIEQGWKLLFDGKTLNGWHTYNKKVGVGKKWRVEDEAIMFEGRKRFKYKFEGRMFEMGDTDKLADGGIDIVTDDSFENFEFELDWKISEGGNSGIFYSVLEDPNYNEAWNTSPEMQVLDDQVHKDGLIYKHRSSDLYDLIACYTITVRPQGEWNRIRLIKNRGKVEHWLNGVMVLQYDANSPEWSEMLLKSKFSKLKDFGVMGKRRLGLQDHDNQVWYRNIRIKELK